LKEIKLASSTWGTEEISALHSVIDSDNYTMGRKVREYEKEFANYFGAEYCVMVSSGSAANLLMIAGMFYHPDERLRLKAGDEVIVPAVSWSTTYFPLQQYGLKLKFVDIDIDTLNFDLGKLEGAINDDTRVIMAVNLLGNPNEFDVIRKLILEKGITLLEDNCESMGATFEDKQCGTFGLAGTFSSFFSHHISTMEGGCVVTDDEKLFHSMLSLRAHGWTRNLPLHNHVTGELNSDPFYETFNFVLPGYNLRPLEMSGAVGLEQLKKLKGFVGIRRENFARFSAKMKPLTSYIIQKEVGSSSAFGFSIVLCGKLKGKRAELISRFLELHIECRPIVTGNFVRQPVIKYFDYMIAGDLDNADYIHDHGLFIGNHHFRMFEEIDHIISTLREFEMRY
jgi:CDP-6-deoxy-D-xylo-4-hexulose-3-dehydrase